MKENHNDRMNIVRNANMWFFFICGMGLSCWAPLVPFAKDRLGLSESDLGILLLLLGGGAMTMMPLSGLFTSKYGSRRMMVTGGLLIALTLPVLAFSSSVIIMAIALFLFGGGVGMLDVSMNTHGIIVQRYSTKPIFSMLHGLFSVGSLVGALSLSFFVKWGLSPVNASTIFSLIIVFVAIAKYRNLFSKNVEDERSDKMLVDENEGVVSQKSVWLNGSVLLIGFFCFSFFLIEGAMLDWSAVFMRDVKNIPVELGGLGYAAFSIAMAVMRLFGDKVISKLNNKAVVLGGGIIAVVGLLVVIISNIISLILIGFILIGIGIANTIPVFFSEGGKLKNMKTSVALSAITTIGYSGQLAGPALIGFIAELFSLPLAFMFLIMVVAFAITVYFFHTIKQKKSKESF